MKTKELKNTNGITLIALVITIIVILIIAGVSVTTLTGENGIIRNVENATKENEKAKIIEDIKMDIMDRKTENAGNISENEIKNILTQYGVLSDDETILNTKAGNYKLLISDICDEEFITFYNSLIPNEDFVYGAYLDSRGYRIDKAYGDLRTHHKLYAIQDIKIVVNDDTLSNYIATLSLYDEDENFIGVHGINAYMENGKMEITKEKMLTRHANAKFFRVNVGIYNSDKTYTKIPETAIINVYSKANKKDSKWKNRIINIMGDSITEGYGLEDKNNERYSKLLEVMTGATINNYGLSGSKISDIDGDSVQSFVDRMSNMNTNADLILLFGGTNDYWHHLTTIGEENSTDTSTFYGAINYCLEYLKTNYSDTRYLFIFPYNQSYHGVTSEHDYNYGSLGDFRDAFRKACENYNVPFLDLNANGGLDIERYTIDGVHANNEGHKIIADRIYYEIENNI